jgi:hypothetical protein
MSVRIQAVWTKAFHGFSQSLQEYFGIVPPSDYDPFVPNPSQFIIYQLSYQSKVFSLVTDKTHERCKQEDIRFFLNSIIFIIYDASEFYLTVLTHFVQIDCVAISSLWGKQNVGSVHKYWWSKQQISRKIMDTCGQDKYLYEERSSNVST